MMLKRLPSQLDRIFVSHYHHPEDGFPNLEEMDANAQSDGQSSPSSVLRKTRNLNSAGNGGIRRFGMEVCVLIPADGTS